MEEHKLYREFYRENNTKIYGYHHPELDTEYEYTIDDSEFCDKCPYRTVIALYSHKNSNSNLCEKCYLNLPRYKFYNNNESVPNKNNIYCYLCNEIDKEVYINIFDNNVLCIGCVCDTYDS